MVFCEGVERLHAWEAWKLLIEIRHLRSPSDIVHGVYMRVCIEVVVLRASPSCGERGGYGTYSGAWSQLRCDVCSPTLVYLAGYYCTLQLTLPCVALGPEC